MELMPHHTQVVAVVVQVMLAEVDLVAVLVATEVLDWHLILAELLLGTLAVVAVEAQLAVFVQQVLEQVHLLEQLA
jgi:hypothetical protein